MIYSKFDKYTDRAETELLKKCTELRDKFLRCNIKTDILDEKDLIQLCNSFLNLNYADKESVDIDEDNILMLGGKR